MVSLVSHCDPAVLEGVPFHIIRFKRQLCMVKIYFNNELCVCVCIMNECNKYDTDPKDLQDEC